MVKKRYTHIPAKKRAPLVENIDSFDQVRRNSGPAKAVPQGPIYRFFESSSHPQTEDRRLPDVEYIDNLDKVNCPGHRALFFGTVTAQQAAPYHEKGWKVYCMERDPTMEEMHRYYDRMDAYNKELEALARKTKNAEEKKMEDEFAQKKTTTKDSEDDNVVLSWLPYPVMVTMNETTDGGDGVEQKTSSTKDEEKITEAVKNESAEISNDYLQEAVPSEQQTNPGIPKESKKAMVASSEVDPPISKDLTSLATGDCRVVANESPNEEEVENVNKIDQVDSLKGEFHISFESEGSPDVVKTRDGSVKEKEMGEGETELRAAINKGMRRGFLLPKESKKAPISKNADSLILNERIPSFESGNSPDVTDTTSTVDPVSSKENRPSSLDAGDCPEKSKPSNGPVKREEDEEEWHDEDTHGPFNPADPKCKCAIS